MAPLSRRRTPEELREAYEEGASLLDLANEEFCSPPVIREMIVLAGGTIRKAGERRNSGYNNPTRDPKTPRPTGTRHVKNIGNPSRLNGKRRRGRY